MGSECIEEGCLLIQVAAAMVAYPGKSTLAAVPPERNLDHCVTLISKVPAAHKAEGPWAVGASMFCQDKCSAVPGSLPAPQLGGGLETGRPSN